MNRHHTHRFELTAPLPAALLLLGFVWAGSLAAEQRIDRTVDASSGGTVTIECLAGSLEIVGWDRKEVQISGTIGDDAEIEIDGGDDVDIEISPSERKHNRDMQIKADLEIRVPSDSSIEIEGLSVMTRVSGVNGDVDIESMSGDIYLDGSFPKVDVENISGKTTITGSSSRIDAETVSGTLIIDGVTDSIVASAVSGMIEISAGDLSRVELETVSGSIKFNGGLTRDGRLTIESYSGNTELTLPASTSADIEIETLSGKIENGLTDDQVTRVDKYGPGRKLRVTLGSGDARVRVESFSGNVKLNS